MSKKQIFAKFISENENKENKTLTQSDSWFENLAGSQHFKNLTNADSALYKAFQSNHSFFYHKSPNHLKVRKRQDNFLD